jgi:hypothetical protein
MIAGRRLLGHTVTHDGDASAYVREMRRVLEIWANDLMRPTPLQRLFAKNGHFSRCKSAAAHGGDEQNNNLWLPGIEPQSGGKRPAWRLPDVLLGEQCNGCLQPTRSPRRSQAAGVLVDEGAHLCNSANARTVRVLSQAGQR